MIPDSPSRVREILASLDLRPSKRLGQNFLCDGNWIRKAVAALPPDIPLVEIGPGLGALTGEALRRGHAVHAVESDDRLCRHLRDTLAGADFHLSKGDAVEQPLAGFDPGGFPFALLANPPFAITSPWFDALLRAGRPLPDPLALILQKEGVERAAAAPGSKAYGPTAIRLALAYEFESSAPLPGSAFHPQPGVDSVFAIWRKRSSPRLLPPDQSVLLRALFGNRRKMLRQGLRKHLPPEDIDRWRQVLTRNGRDETARPEELPPELWHDLLCGRGTRPSPTGE